MCHRLVRHRSRCTGLPVTGLICAVSYMEVSRIIPRLDGAISQTSAELACRLCRSHRDFPGALRHQITGQRGQHCLIRLLHDRDSRQPGRCRAQRAVSTIFRVFSVRGRATLTSPTIAPNIGDAGCDPKVGRSHRWAWMRRVSPNCSAGSCKRGLIFGGWFGASLFACLIRLPLWSGCWSGWPGWRKRWPSGIRGSWC